MSPDTGIVTLHRSANFGAFLQAFALQAVLRTLGRRPCFIETHHEPRLGRRIKKEVLKFRQEGLLRYRHAALMRRAVAKYLETGGSPSARYEAVVIGSDEVWSVTNPNFAPAPAFFGIGLDSPRICSYAPSMGQSTAADLADDSRRIRGLESMQALAARDDATVEAVAKLTSRPVEKVLDPTLLISWDRHVIERRLPRTMLVYTYRFDDRIVARVRETARRLGLRVVAVGIAHRWADESITCSPFEFLGLIRSADAVVTDTFHGSIMSSLLGANFAIVEQGAKKKLSQLVRDLRLHERVVRDAEKLDEVLSEPFIGPVVRGEIGDARAASIAYLARCLNA